MQWYFERGGGQEGPVDAEGLRSMLAEGALSPENKVWRKGLPDWLPVSEVDELVAPAPVAPPEPVPQAATPAVATPAPAPVATEPPASTAPAYVPPSAPPEAAASAGQAQGPPAGVCGNPVEAFKRVVLENYLTFSGRAPRSEYWWFAVAYFLAIVFASLIHEGLVGLVYLGLVIPSIAVLVRRLHDIGKSGVHALVLLVPMIGPFVVLYWLAQDSETGSNSYGANPKG